MKFLIDECLSPSLVVAANQRGFEAYHVVHRGWGGFKDAQLLSKMIDEELVLVTNNLDDFRALIISVELHPGLVVIVDNVRRDRQVALFNIALDLLSGITSLLNKVVEVSEDVGAKAYDLPLIK